MSQKVEKVHKGGGGVSKKHQKVQNSKFGLFDKRGGGHIFIFFPNSNAHFRYFSWRKNKLVLKWFLGNFKCFKFMFLVLMGPRLSLNDETETKTENFWVSPYSHPTPILKCPNFMTLVLITQKTSGILNDIILKKFSEP